MKNTTQIHCRALKALGVFLTLSSLTACGLMGYTYEPTFFAKPRFYEAKEVEGIEIPEIPSREFQTVEFNYRTSSALPSEGSHYTYTDKTNKLSSANSPSLAVILPNESSTFSKTFSQEFSRDLIETTLGTAGFTMVQLENASNETSKQLDEAKTKARYAMLVNELSAEPRADREPLQLKNIPEFQSTLSQLKRVLPSNKHGLIHTEIPAPGYQARFSAKILDLKTGAIVWIGRYSKNSSDLKDFRITYSCEKFTNNDDQVLNKVRNFNQKLTQHRDAFAQARSDYENSFSAASTPKDFDEEQDMLSFAQQVKKSYRSAEQNYIRLYEDSQILPSEREKVASNINWTFDYSLPKPKTSPSLEALSTPPLVPSQRSHVEQLLEATVVPLLQVFAPAKEA